MFRKALLVVCLINIALYTTAEAQDQRFKAGFVLGANLSQIDGDQSDGYIKLGISGGLRGVAIISDKIDLSIELLFDQRGSRSQKIFDVNFTPFKIVNNYVSVPVVFNYQDWLDQSEEFYKVHFHAGFSYGRLLNANVDDAADSIFRPISEFFNQDDLSILVGVTFFATKNIGVTGRFSRSLTKLYDNGDGPISVPRPLISKQFTLHTIYMF